MGGGAAGGNPITQIVPLVLIVVVFYLKPFSMFILNKFNLN